MHATNFARHSAWLSLTACLLLRGPGHAAEHDEVISAERPGFSSSPIALAPGTLQIEGGYQYTQDNDPVDADDHTLPLMLVRIGLVERMELQLGWAGWSWSDVDGQRFDGANDATAGVKWQLTSADAAVPLAVFAGVTLPVGDDAFGSDGVDPTIGLFWTHAGNRDWFGTVLVSESDGEVSFANAAGLSLPIRSDLGAYVEYFGNYGGGSGPQHNLNGGLAYLPRHDLQLDVQVGLGLNRRAADAFIGFGAAYRF